MNHTLLHQHSVENVGNKNRDVTTVDAYDLDISGDEDSIPLAELIENLQTTLAAIPEQFRDKAIVQFTAYGEYASMSASVTFKRPETDEELAARRRWLASLDTEQEDRDRREFERLSAKYQDSK